MYHEYNYKEVKKHYLKRLLWLVVRETIFRSIVIPKFYPIRNLILRCFGAKISLYANVYSTSKIWAPWNLKIGYHSIIGPHTIIYNKDKIEIGCGAVVSQYAYLCTAGHDINDPHMSLVTKPIRIENNAWVAADAFVGPGVTIGEGAVVGARACVFKDVEPWTVVGGNPAKFIKRRQIRIEDNA